MYTPESSSSRSNKAHYWGGISIIDHTLSGPLWHQMRGNYIQTQLPGFGQHNMCVRLLFFHVDYSNIHLYIVVWEPSSQIVKSVATKRGRSCYLLCEYIILKIDTMATKSNIYQSIHHNRTCIVVYIHDQDSNIFNSLLLFIKYLLHYDKPFFVILMHIYFIF